MIRLFKKFISLFLSVAVIWFCLRLLDRQDLQDKIIRLHVVANSDSTQDQNLKLEVRDAILEEIEALGDFSDPEYAKAALESILPELEKAANRVLRDAGSAAKAVVTLVREEFPLRSYETFSLPSGIYNSLRVSIGEAQGQNWWCVVFPGLCLDAVSEEVRSTAAGAGFSDSLSNAITGEKGYFLDFYILEVLGRLENFFHLG